MRRNILLFIILLPLTLLVSLSCPVKQNVKQLLGMPASVSLQLERNSSALCNFSLTQYLKEEKHEAKKRNQLKYNLVQGAYLSALSVPKGALFDKGTGQNPQLSTSIPIFIIYRKLII